MDRKNCIQVVFKMKLSFRKSIGIKLGVKVGMFSLALGYDTCNIV